MTEKCSHEHEHGNLTEQMIGNEIDPASQYLAGALRKSFFVLSVIMAFLVLAYILSGIETVSSGERAVVLRFGKLVGATSTSRGDVLADGLHFTWPYPIDEVVRVSITKKTLKLESFWHYERPGESGKPEHEKRPVGAGLRPKYDGALITGDHGLVHVIWDCEYQIPGDNEAVLDYVVNVTNESKAVELLTSTIEDASIRAAATYPAEAISRNHPGFRAEVQRLAQESLNELRTGIKITALAGTHTPPLQALAAFRGVTAANQEKDQTIQGAMQMAAIATQTVAGENWSRLVEAIDAYEAAGDDDELKAQRLQVVTDLLHDENTTGKARQVIKEAESYASEVVSRAEQAYEEFSRLVATYKTKPDMMISRLWMDTIEEIFASDVNIRINIPRNTKYILYPQLDPKILRGIERTKTEKIRKRVATY